VYSITDVERLEGYGWRKADPSEQVKPGKVAKVATVASDEAAEVVAPKRGRPFKAK
jgi:hypothetical protein